MCACVGVLSMQGDWFLLGDACVSVLREIKLDSQHKTSFMSQSEIDKIMFDDDDDHDVDDVDDNESG